jgi:hypothetical protein
MRSRIIGLIILVLIGLTISECSSADRNDAGEITKAGDVNAFDIQTGDCFNDLPFEDETALSSVEAVPCNEPHHWQAFYSGTVTLTSFSEASARQVTSDECDQAVSKLISQMSSIKLDAFQNARIAYFYPTEESWNSKGDRTLDCLIGSDTDTYFTSIFD